ncbi:hypothetical protein HRI_000054500 [Hibiscus trionum]|uniref:Uncharacterized protein n=1 Tax=Hibiscus trionum TaxID=183268 RepID=A0A9W7GRQ1_HIBTR|nr:hypothetical protein HRI_000054500 [Hibiscus trionum]
MGLCVPVCCLVVSVLVLAVGIAAVMGWLNGWGGGEGVHKLGDALGWDYCDPKYSTCGRPFLSYAAPPPF